MTLALTSCPFVLSLTRCRSLAVTLGLPVSIAWLWPCAIDLAIAQATLFLLSLSRRAIVVVMNDDAAEAVSLPKTPHRARPSRPQHRVEESAESDSARVGPSATADIERWQPVAESIVREGVTSKHPQLVATILAQREAGVPPSTIGRHHNVHHTTVGRILNAAQTLTA
jgi:hypothetical protein